MKEEAAGHKQKPDLLSLRQDRDRHRNQTVRWADLLSDEGTLGSPASPSAGEDSPLSPERGKPQAGKPRFDYRSEEQIAREDFSTYAYWPASWRLLLEQVRRSAD